jgi:glucose-6-phosphate isomerase
MTVTTLKSWQDLAAAPKPELKTLFTTDSGRFKKLSIALPGLLADFSKQPVTDETLKLLLAFAREQGLEKARDAMLRGDKINATENRAVLHTALRAADDATIAVDGKNVMDDVGDELQEYHRCRQYRHRRLQSRAPAGHTGAGRLPPSAHPVPLCGERRGLGSRG